MSFFKKPVFTALSPNAQLDDIFLALTIIFKPWKWIKGSDLQKLAFHLKKILGLDYVFLFESGRTCLYAILKSLNLETGDEVLLQAYTCVAVPEPVLWANLKPVYVDCDECTLNMSCTDLEKKITSKSRVLIIQHTFGNPADLDRLLQIAKKHNLFVIEDCAHALGAVYKGKLVGSFGDVSFFSFGRDKVISSVFGGAIATNNSDLAKKIESFHHQCRDLSFCWISKQIIHPIVLGLVKATYRLYVGRFLLAFVKRTGLISRAVYEVERFGQRPPFIFSKMPNALAKMALNQLNKLDNFNSHRKLLAEFYAKNIIDLPLKSQSSLDSADSIFLRFLIKSSQSLNILAAARKEEIFLGDWYTTAVAPDRVNYQKIFFNPESCPVAQKIASESLNLPTDINTDLRKASIIVNFLHKFYETKN